MFIHQQIALNLGLLQDWKPYYRYVTVPLLENEHYLLFWERTLQTDHLVVQNHADIVMWDKRVQNVKIMDIAVPLCKNIQLSYATKIQKYGQLKHEITGLRRRKSTTFHSVVISVIDIIDQSDYLVRKFSSRGLTLKNRNGESNCNKIVFLLL